MRHIQRGLVLGITRSLVKEGSLKRAFFDSPRTLYETLSVYPYNGKGLMVAPSEWIRAGRQGYYVITKSVIDKKASTYRLLNQLLYGNI